MSESSPTTSRTGSGIAFSDSGPHSDITIVLIHGSLDRMAGMAHVARLLQREWRVIRYDRRGYGRSLPHDGPFRVSDHVQDLYDVLDVVGDVTKTLLIGHSFGGHVALAAAIKRPTQVIGASIYESPLSWMPWWPGSTATNQPMATDPAEAAETFMRRLVGDDKWNSLPEATKQTRRREGVALVGELTSLRSQAPYDFSDISVPVICGYGELGASRHHDGAAHVAKSVSHGKLEMIAGAGHGAPTSHPQEYVAQLVMPHLV